MFFSARSCCAGPETSCIVAEGGQIFMAGMGSNNQLAKDDDKDERLPIKIDFGGCEGKAPKAVSQVAFGAQHTIMLVH